MRSMGYVVAAVLVAVGIGATAEAEAQVIDGVLHMEEGASLFAPADDAFNVVGRDGLTIEGWFYLEDLPDVGQVQTFFSLPTKYTFGIGVVQEEGQPDPGFDPAKARLFGSVWADDWGMTFSSVFSVAGDRDVPIGEWFHVALQLHAEAPGVASYYANGRRRVLDRPEGGGGIVLPTAARALRIASPARWLPQRDFRLEHGPRITAFEGLVDDIRVSDVLRYNRADDIPPRRLGVDRNTLALWQFEGATPFRDASGNGHDLTPGGSAAVEAGSRQAGRVSEARRSGSALHGSMSSRRRGERRQSTPTGLRPLS